MIAKKQYDKMITDALLALSDRGGSSRQAILAYIQNKYEDVGSKQFGLQLKKYCDDGIFTKGKNGQRVKLSNRTIYRMQKKSKNGKKDITTKSKAKAKATGKGSKSMNKTTKK